MKTCLKWLILFFLLCGDSPVWSNETEFIGIIKNVDSEAFIIRNEMSETAVIGKKVAIGDVLKTGPDGKMGVVFKDDTTISMGPETEIFLQDFLFKPAEGNLSFIAKMLKGTVSFISGQIAKLSPESVQFETPVATIGPRGTHFLVKAENN